ncbi:MAG: type II toxin-antitoxin system VapC family toxin [Capsulimonadaceae bacterium]
MMIDTSAIVAILAREPETAAFLNAILDDPVVMVSACSVVESGMVIEGRYGVAGAADLDLWLLKTRAEIVPFDARQAELARRAWRRYGKGNHPASLNFGDCCVYAAAKATGEPILCKGNDFTQTDIPTVRT